jgi:plasmid stabilization system protein ParE
VIFFDALPDGIEVVRVLHGARDLPTVLSEDQ